MYSCDSCGAGLRFDIASGMLLCPYCGSEKDPKTAKNGAHTGDEFETNVYTCTQCGGEIYTLDNDITGFCSYCGATMAFQSRVVKMQKAERIIPFRKTKEDCKDSYHRMVVNAVFAPNEMRDTDYVESFRGIYMPYWMYNVKQQHPVELEGTKSYTKGKYDYVETYRLNAQLDMDYKDIKHDASKTFPDEISEAIEPYNLDQDVEEFNDAFLCGFYGELQDTDNGDYKPYAQDIANKLTCEKLEKAWDDITVENSDQIKAKLESEFEEPRMMLLPVWFLSYRNKNRVSYTVINGQTGKASGMIPVSLPKFLLGVLIGSIPIWLILNLFNAMKPSVLLSMVAFLAVYGCCLYKRQLENAIRLNYDYVPEEQLEFTEKQQQRMKQILEERGELSIGESFCIIGAFLFVIAYAVTRVCGIDTFEDFYWLISWKPLLITGCMLYSFGAIRGAKNMNVDYELCKILSIPVHVSYYFGLATILLSVVFEIINPASDYIYYAIVTVITIGAIVMFVDLIHCHNMSASRPLPQFRHKGGDDRAK